MSKHAEYMRQWRLRHPELINKSKEYHKKWVAEHPKYYTEWAEKNREKIREQTRQRHAKMSPEKKRLKRQRYKKAHPDKIREYKRKWWAKNKAKPPKPQVDPRERFRRYNKRHPDKRNARSRASEIPLGPKCSLCGSTANLQRHHISYENDVIVTLCRDCHRAQHKNKITDILER